MKYVLALIFLVHLLFYMGVQQRSALSGKKVIDRVISQKHNNVYLIDV